LITLRDALTRAAGQLAAHPDLRATAVPDASLLFMHALNLDRAALLAHPERPLDRDQQAILQRLIERRLRFEPIQYITGQQEFFGLALRVTPDVLIPRPETELLVEAVLNRLTDHNAPLRIVDVGTGSGAIAIALAHHLPNAFVTALDLSPSALAIAQQNAQIHALAARICFLHSDLLAAVASEPPFDAIVSNPPYIPDADVSTLHPQVRDFEPSRALFAGESGLEVYERLIPQAFSLLKPSGLLALEFGFGQCDAIASLLSAWRPVEFLNDLQQIPRVALARRS
jgi:release factor glutamine methyltransferase